MSPYRIAGFYLGKSYKNRESERGSERVGVSGGLCQDEGIRGRR